MNTILELHPYMVQKEILYTHISATKKEGICYQIAYETFAVGLTLNNTNIMDTSKGSKDGNLLGKCLMENRNEL